MAKASQTNVIEQHVEKAVLALSILFLLYVLLHWVFSSPREVEVANQVTSPADVDQALLDQADRIKTLNDNVKPKTARPPDFEAVLSKYRTPSLPEGITVGVATPRRPIMLQKEVGADQPKLQVEEFAKAMPRPQTPKVWAGRELLSTEGEPTDVVATHVAAVYPWGKLAEAWNEKLKNSVIELNLVVLKVIIERQEQLHDGSWSEARRIKTVSMPLDDGAEVPVTPPYDGKNVDEVLDVLNELARDWQGYILEPPYWDIWWPTHEWGDWCIHLPHTEVSKLAAEQGLRTVRRKPIYRRAATPTRRTDRTPPMGMEEFEMRGEMRIPSRTPPKKKPKITPKTRKPSRTKAPRGMMEMGMMEMDMMRPHEGARTPVRRKPKPKPKPVKPVRTPTEIVSPEATPVPELSEQMLAGSVLAWRHDTSLQSLKVYRYRVRLVFANPLLTCDEDVKKPADAKTLSLQTPWSNWSATVFVPKATEFFMTGSNPAQQAVRVIVFSHSLGQRVKYPFTIRCGQSIGRTEKVDVANPADGNWVKKKVDFAAGAVVVAFDFEKRVRKGYISKPTVEMLYLDEKGCLRRRLLAEDKSSKRFKKLIDETLQGTAAAGTER